MGAPKTETTFRDESRNLRGLAASEHERDSEDNVSKMRLAREEDVGTGEGNVVGCANEVIASIHFCHRAALAFQRGVGKRYA